MFLVSDVHRAIPKDNAVSLGMGVEHDSAQVSLLNFGRPASMSHCCRPLQAAKGSIFGVENKQMPHHEMHRVFGAVVCRVDLRALQT